MKSLFHDHLQAYRHTSRIIVGLLVVMIFLITSCVPATESPIISPKLGAALAKIEKGGEFKADPTPTPLLVKALKPDQIYAGLPADIAAAIKTANPKNATALALKVVAKGVINLTPMPIQNRRDRLGSI